MSSSARAVRGCGEAFPRHLKVAFVLLDAHELPPVHDGRNAGRARPQAAVQHGVAFVRERADEVAHQFERLLRRMNGLCLRGEA